MENKYTYVKVKYKRRILVLLFGFLFLLSPLSFTNKQSSSFIDIIPSFVILLFVYFSQRHELNLKNHHIYVIALYIVALISTFVNKRTIDRTIITFALFVLFYILITAFCFEKKEMLVFQKFIIVSSLLSSITIIASGIFDVPYSWYRYSLNIIGINKNPNYVTGYIMLGYANLLYLLFFHRKKNYVDTLIKTICILLMIVAFVLSGTRAAVLTSIVLAFVVITSALCAHRIRLVTLLYIIIALICIVVLINIVASYLPDKVFRRIQINNIIYSEDSRLDMWTSAINAFKDNIWGLGINGAESLSNGLYGTSLHNTLLQVLIDWGLLGCLFFIASFFSETNKLEKKQRQYLNICSLALFIPVLFQNGLYAVDFWFPLIVRRVIIEFFLDQKTEDDIFSKDTYCLDYVNTHETKHIRGNI